LQAGDPSLGARGQRGDVISRKRQLHNPAQKLLCLVWREAQVNQAQLGQLTTTAQARHRQRWIGASGDHQVHIFRQVIEKKREDIVNRLSRDEVVIIQNEDKRINSIGLVDQRR
jgi:Mg/Co/Ni transporter MgtE